MSRWALVLFALWLHPASGWTLTLSDIRTAVRRNIRDTATDSSLQRYSDSQLTIIANEGQRDFVMRTLVCEKFTSFAVTSGQNVYNLSEDLLVVAHVYLSGGGFTELEQKTRIQAFQDDPLWAANTGTPDSFWIRMDPDTDKSPQLILMPLPDSNAYNANVQFYNLPADLSADSSTPFDGIRPLYVYHDALVYYVSKVILYDQGDTAEADYYGKLYENIVANASERYGRVAELVSPPKATVPQNNQ